jgi:TRAP-type C4-dicarboxylate transport system substrate-binding protein
MKVQEAAWQSLTQKMQANATPDIASFQAKMGPVIESFVAKVGPKGREYIDAVRAAQ